MKFYLGIDPGMKGGLAIVAGEGALCTYIRMPENPLSIVRHIRGKMLDTDGKIVAIIEKAQAMPKQGVSSMFSYGQGYGFLLGALTTLDIPYHEVRPAEWKKTMLEGVADKKDKGASILACERIFPSVELIPHGCKKPHDGIAEAILIAEYGRRKNL